VIETARLRLRRWEAGDRAPFAALNADPAVMDFPRPLTAAESDAEIADFEARWQRDGFCFAAIEGKAEGVLIGMAGLARCHLDAPICPCVEIGWRLARAHWGRGYATEAAAAWLAYGLDVLGLEEIVAFTDPGNHRSLAVMRRIGMVPAPERDFEHPDMPVGHPLRPQRVFVARRAPREVQA
jgi:RimJ/RimL family protein N-acetyltransferase